MAAIISVLTFSVTSPVAAQQSDELFSGDSVRVNLRIVGLTAGDQSQLHQELEDQEEVIAELRRSLRAEESQLERMKEELGLNELGAVVNQRIPPP